MASTGHSDETMHRVFGSQQRRRQPYRLGVFNVE
jgi:hypothetical protein